MVCLFLCSGHMVLTGGSDGLIAISSPTTGMTVRVISDHKGAPITNIDVTLSQEHEISVTAPQLWLATSADRRVSVWSADWSKDFCELVDWLTFPAPAFTPDGTVIAKQDQKVLNSSLKGETPYLYFPRWQVLMIYSNYDTNNNFCLYIMRLCPFWASILEIHFLHFNVFSLILTQNSLIL